MANGPARPAAMFQGYDSVIEAGRATAVCGQIEKHGGSLEVHCQVCEDISTLAKTFNISQSLLADLGPIGRVDQKTDFLRELNLTTNTIALVVCARHITGIETATNVKLADGINPLGTTDEIRKFVSAFGDSYIASRTLGGEYFAVYAFYAETLKEKQSLAAELKARGLQNSLVDPSLQTKLSTIGDSTKTECAIRQVISGVQKPKSPAANDIINYALSFFVRSVPPGSIVLGFDGLSGEYLDQLRVIYATLKPAKWRTGKPPASSLTSSQSQHSPAMPASP